MYNINKIFFCVFFVLGGILMVLSFYGCASGTEIGRYMEIQDQFRTRTEKDLRTIAKAHNTVAKDVQNLKSWQGTVNEKLEGFKAEKENEEWLENFIKNHPTNVRR